MIFSRKVWIFLMVKTINEFMMLWEFFKMLKIIKIFLIIILILIAIPVLQGLLIVGKILMTS